MLARIKRLQLYSGADKPKLNNANAHLGNDGLTSGGFSQPKYPGPEAFTALNPGPLN